MNRSQMLKSCISLIVFLAISAAASPSVFAQNKNCGAEGQRPCKIWERIPSCDKKLKENFKLNMCVGPRTQVNTKGQYIPRKDTKPTRLRLCNRSSRPMIYAAVAYWADNPWGWVSEGWLRIPSGRCNDFDLGDDYSGAVYVYGSSDDGTEWNGRDSDFCIKPYEAFDIDNSDRLECRSRDYSIVGMVRQTIKSGRINTYNFGN